MPLRHSKIGIFIATILRNSKPRRIQIDYLTRHHNYCKISAAIFWGRALYSLYSIDVSEKRLITSMLRVQNQPSHLMHAGFFSEDGGDILLIDAGEPQFVHSTDCIFPEKWYAPICYLIQFCLLRTITYYVRLGKIVNLSILLTSTFTNRLSSFRGCPSL
jgi:hypothetical protein